MYTDQSLFETVARHLFSQGRKAMEGQSCRYRTEDGLMCAVGCVLPDELYSEELEGSTAPILFDVLPEFSKMFTPVQKNLLTSLQWVHDDEANWDTSETLMKALIGTGASYGLSFTFLDSCYFEMNK